MLTKVVNEPNVTLLRSYQRPKARDYLSENLKVSEACLATSAAPSYFPPFYHERSGLQLIDPSKSFNDFLSLTISEAKELWPGRSFLVIHIGADLRPSAFHIDSHRIYHFDIGKSCGFAPDDYCLNPTRQALASQSHPEWCRQVDLVECADALGRSWTLTSDERNCARSLSSNGMRTRRDDIRPPMDDTCSWLLKHSTFNSWLQQGQGIFWITGKPGSGKSTLMKYLLGHQEKTLSQGDVLASHFFHFAGGSLERSIAGMLRSLLCQILEQKQSEGSTYLPREIFLHNQKNLGNEWDWNVRDLTDCLISAVSNPERGSFVFFIDALDECDGDQRVLVDTLELLIVEALSSGQVLRLAISCRPRSDLDVKSSHVIRLEDENSQAISAFTRQSLKLNITSGSNNESLYLQPLVREITEKANGVFLWVCLVVKELQVNCKDHVSTKYTSQALQHLPNDLDSLYTHLLKRISQEANFERTRKALQWILLAVEPLSLLEIHEVMHIECHDLPENQATDSQLTALRLRKSDRISFEQQLAESCRGVVEVTPSRTVRFAHYSVKEYLLKNHDFVLDGRTVGSAHFEIAKACITKIIPCSLSVGNAKLGGCSPSKDNLGTQTDLGLLSLAGQFFESCQTTSSSRPACKQIQADRCPYYGNGFQGYAVRHWSDHVRLSERNGGPSSAALLAYLMGEQDSTSWKLKIQCTRSSWLCGTTVLQIAIRHDLTGLAKECLDYGLDVNAQGSCGSSASCAALDSNSLAAIKPLLRPTAFSGDISSTQKSYSPLQLAVQLGQIEIVEMLLRKGARIDEASVDGASVLLWRTILGRLDHLICQLMLSLGNLDPSERVLKGQVPLLYLLKEQPKWDSRSHRRDLQLKLVKLLVDCSKPRTFQAVDEAGDTVLLFGVAENLLPKAIGDLYSVKDQIGSVLQESAQVGSATVKVTCQATWEVLEYFQLVLPEHTGIDSVFTLTGDIAKAQGTTCGEYMRMRWPLTGARLLQAFEAATKSHDCSKTWCLNWKNQMLTSARNSARARTHSYHSIYSKERCIKHTRAC